MVLQEEQNGGSAETEEDSLPEEEEIVVVVGGIAGFVDCAKILVAVSAVVTRPMWRKLLAEIQGYKVE